MLMLPIPEARGDGGTARYAELHDVDGTDYLSRLRALGYTAFDRHSTTHLDPDLVPSVRPRGPGWRGMLGQAGAAAAHLVNRGVGPGDLFLFWGRYAPVGTDGRLPRSGHRHAVFGYLEVGGVVDVGSGEPLTAAPYHPHAAGADRRPPDLVYVATDRLTRHPELPGWGVFRWAPRLQLTDPGNAGLGSWRLPGCFHPSTGTALSHHPPGAWSEPDGGGTVTVARRGRGQEFVCEASDEVVAWALDLVVGSERWAPPDPVDRAR
jgi:hypothetical protein